MEKSFNYLLCKVLDLEKKVSGGSGGGVGTQGPPGQNGKSAFELWKDFTGRQTASLQEFLESLKGEKGQDGAIGTDYYVTSFSINSEIAELKISLNNGTSLTVDIGDVVGSNFN